MDKLARHITTVVVKTIHIVRQTCKCFPVVICLGYRENTTGGGDMINRIISGQGGTYTPNGVSVDLETGYMVSLPDYERIIPLGDICETDITTFLTEHNSILVQDNHYFGVWVDNGLAYFDISVNIPTLASAMNAARAWNQLAIWDCKNNCSIEVK